MITQKRLLLLPLFLLCIHSVLLSQHTDTVTPDKNGLAIGVKLTTFGPGIEFVYAIHPTINLHAGAAYFRYNYNQDIESGDATTRNAQVKFSTISLGADWQFVSFMHVAAGMLFNFTQIDFDVFPTTPDAQNNGVVSYQLKPNKLSPYISLGFGRTISKNKRVSVGFDIGVAYQGSMAVESSVKGDISDAKLHKWTNNIKSGSESYTYYPIINLQVAYRIF
ncbi:MAG: hypothetical protein KKB74_11505 [Bacteroidetes bacterium]|nr:hypothetical protein [Bacteroidota bacterium]